ncbi:MAG: hypothetical protein LLF96_06395 [Eubacteriales bacterium]|nr:hypothetical protein [Eubacteriales bacterium]
MQEMFELADRLKELRDAKKEAEQRVKELNAAIDDADYALSELMAQTETQSFNRAGTLFYLTTTTRASARPDRKTELYGALKAEGYGDLVYETVNANSLSAFVKEQRAENDDALPEWLNGLVTLFEKSTVGVRRA